MALRYKKNSATEWLKIISNTGAGEKKTVKKTAKKTYLLPLGSVKIQNPVRDVRQMAVHRAATRSAEIQAVAIREGELKTAIA